jgi:hypothetical protein
MSSHAAKTRAGPQPPLEYVLTQGVASFRIPAPHVAEFESKIREAIAIAHSCVLEANPPDEDAPDNKRTIRELREIRKTGYRFLTAVLSTRQATMDALDNAYSVDDADLPDYRRAVEYLLCVSGHALDCVSAPKKRGRKPNQKMGYLGVAPLDDLIINVCRAVCLCEGKWSRNKNNVTNPSLNFFWSLSNHLPYGFLSGLHAWKVYDISSKIMPTLHQKGGN